MVTAAAFRAMALALPEASERETWGHPTFRVRDKLFATMSSEGDSATVKAALGEQAALVARDPATFWVPAYVGRHGWVAIRIGAVDPGELRELITEAWRATAPKRLVAAFDAG